MRWIHHAVTATAIVAFLLMTGTTLLGVVARYWLLRGFDWTFELSAILFLWVTFCGVVVAEIRRENVAFTLFIDGLSTRVGRLIALAGAVLLLWFACDLFLSAWSFAERSGARPTPVLRLPRLIQILPLMVFAGCISVIAAVRTVQDTTTFFRGART